MRRCGAGTPRPVVDPDGDCDLLRNLPALEQDGAIVSWRADHPLSASVQGRRASRDHPQGRAQRRGQWRSSTSFPIVQEAARNAMEPDRSAPRPRRAATMPTPIECRQTPRGNRAPGEERVDERSSERPRKVADVVKPRRMTEPRSVVSCPAGIRPSGPRGARWRRGRMGLEDVQKPSRSGPARPRRGPGRRRRERHGGDVADVVQTRGPRRFEQGGLPRFDIPRSHARRRNHYTPGFLSARSAHAEAMAVTSSPGEASPGSG